MLITSSFETTTRERRRFVYAIFGNSCVYSGLEIASKGSTQIYSEHIMKLIAEEQGVPETSLQFYDLATHKHNYTLKPGQFTFLQIYRNEWGWAARDVKCPPHVVSVFRKHIVGAHVVQIYSLFDQRTFDEIRERKEVKLAQVLALTPLFAGTNVKACQIEDEDGCWIVFSC
jgi:hypothetical protein